MPEWAAAPLKRVIIRNLSHDGLWLTETLECTHIILFDIHNGWYQRTSSRRCDICAGAERNEVREVHPR